MDGVLGESRCSVRFSRDDCRLYSSCRSNGTRWRASSLYGYELGLSRTRAESRQTYCRECCLPILLYLFCSLFAIQDAAKRNEAIGAVQKRHETNP